jgi:hypothetical protein
VIEKKLAFSAKRPWRARAVNFAARLLSANIGRNRMDAMRRVRRKTDSHGTVFLWKCAVFGAILCPEPKEIDAL